MIFRNLSQFIDHKQVFAAFKVVYPIVRKSEVSSQEIEIVSTVTYRQTSKPRQKIIFSSKHTETPANV